MHQQQSQQQHQLQPQPRRRRLRQPGEPCDCLRPVIRVFGLLTSFVICGVGVDIYMHGYHAGLYILICALLVLFIELKWLITIFLQLQCGEDNYHNASWCLRCWRCTAVLGSWRPAPLYVVVGAALVLWPHNLWLSYVAGMLLLLLAALRLCKLLRFSSISGKDEGLLPQCDFEKVSGSAEEDFAEVSAQLEDEGPMDDDVC